MNSKQRKTLNAIYSKPTMATIVFTEIESLLISLGCNKTEGNGSRVRFDRDGLAWACHRPHPGKEAKKYQVNQVREFLEKIGVRP